MIQKGADFGFIGQAYEAPMLLQDAQRLINWYCEVSEDINRKSKMPIALLGCPGLAQVATTQVGQVRGFWVLPGNTQALVVTGNTLYLLQVTVPATATSIPQFSTTAIGTLLTNSGPVCIRDNGLQFGGKGGYAVLVDGQFAYYYALSGLPQSITFTAATALGQPTLTVSAIPNGLVVGAACTVTDTLGAISANTLFTGVDFNSVTLSMSQNATATQATDSVTITIPAFGQIVDPAMLAASRVAFIEGWLIFSQPGTRTFFTNATTPYTLLFAGSFYALKDSSTDNLVTLFENNREVWLIGERTSEVWFNAGNTNFAFERIPAIGPQIGCAAPHSITRFGPDLAWLGRNEQGQNIIVRQVQYAWERISTHAVDHAIASYPVVSDAIGFSYEEDGHWFYQITFPTADVTWVFDGKTQMWHQRASFDSVTGSFHRHRANCYGDLGDVRLVGDYQTGQILQLSRAYYSDAGNPLVCVRRCPHIWEEQNRKRIFHGWLQIEFTPGVGLQSGQGSTPTAMLRWSNDGGFSWSNQHTTSLGASGQTRNRAIWRRLGRARDRIYELSYSDPTQRDLIGVTLFFEPEAEEEAA